MINKGRCGSFICFKSTISPSLKTCTGFFVVLFMSRGHLPLQVCDIYHKTWPCGHENNYNLLDPCFVGYFLCFNLLFFV